MTIFLALLVTLFFAAPADAAPLGGAIAVLAGWAGTTVGAFILKTAASMALSSLAQALQRRNMPPPPGIKTETTTAGESTPASLILGRYATAGNMVIPPFAIGHAGDTPNAYLTYVIDMGDFPVTGLHGLWINDERVELLPPLAGDPYPDHQRVGGDYLGKAWIKFFDGTQTTAYGELVGKSGPTRQWASDMIGRGVPYAVLRFKFDREVFQGLPKVLFEIDGIKLYDPRKDSTVGGSGSHRWGQSGTYEFTENPIVQVYNIMRGIKLMDGTNWGGESKAEDLPLANWFAAMNDCDVIWNGEPKFRASYEVRIGPRDLGGEMPADVIDELMRGCSGQLSEYGGVWKARVGAVGVPTLSISDDDIIITDAQDFEPYPGIGQTYNGVMAQYPEPAEKWAAKEAPARFNAEYEAADQDRRLIASLTLPATPYPMQVQRIMRALIEEERRFRRHTITLPPDAAVLEPLDAITWTSPANGYISKVFEVTGSEVDPITLCVRVDLRERDPNDYNWESGYALPYEITNPTTARPGPRTVLGFGAMGFTIKDSAGDARRPAIRLYWDGDQGDARGVRYQIRPAGQTDLASQGSTQDVLGGALVVSDGIVPNTAYQARARLAMDAQTEWTAWVNVTSPAVGLSDEDFVGGIVSLFEDHGLYAIAHVDTLPPSAAVDGQLVFLKSDGELYQWNAAEGRWDNMLDAALQKYVDDNVLTEIQAAIDAANQAIAAEVAALDAQVAAEFAAAQANADQLLSGQALALAELARDAAQTAKTQAETAQTAAQAARDSSLAYRNASQAARDAAQLARDNAQAAAGDAGGSATAASGFANLAETHKTAAGLSATAASASVDEANIAKDAAGNFATAASGSASAASAHKDAAGTSAAAANQSKIDANTARANAVLAKDAAVIARQGAEGAESAALLSEQAAVSAKNAAGDSASAAAGSATTATIKAGEASTSASTATNAKNTATTKAGEAATSASNAATSETNAAGSASTASNQAGLAAGSATLAGDKATAASNSASLANTKAGEASTSATAANTAKNTATTKAGEASTSAANAATSESNAAGSAVTAATSASVAASARLSTVLVEGNPGFEQGLEGWSRLNGTSVEPHAEVAPLWGRGAVLRGLDNLNYLAVRSDKIHWLSTDRVYKARASFIAKGSATQTIYAGVSAVDENGDYAGTNSGRVYLIASNEPLSASDGWKQYESAPFTLADLKAYSGRGNTAGIQLQGMLNFENTDPASQAYLDGIWLEDITEQQNAETAASASASSASVAAVEAGKAKQEATAATQAKTLAETARGQAQTAATNASYAKDDASGSASNALNSANAAASSKTAAGNSATAASNSASLASSKATEAGQSATAASSSASTASTKAGQASTSATNAANSASDALSSKNTAYDERVLATAARNTAQGHATTASNKATEAATSATSADDAKSIAVSAQELAVQVVSQGTGILANQFVPLGNGGWVNATSNATSYSSPHYPGQNAIQWDVTAAQDAYTYVGTTDSLWRGGVNPDAIVVEVEFRVSSGDISGAQVYVDWESSTGNHRVVLTFDEMLPSYRRYSTHVARGVFKRPDSYSGSYVRNSIYVVGNSSGYGATRSAKNMQIFRIQAYNSTTTDASVEEAKLAVADLKGNASAGYLIKAQAGGAASILELVAADGSGGTASAAKISADKIILAGTVTANELAIGDFENYGGGTNPLAVWDLSGSGVRYYPGPNGSGIQPNLIRLSANGSNVPRLSTIAVTEGDEFEVSFNMSRTSDWNGTSGNSKLRFGLPDGTQLISFPYDSSIPTGLRTLTGSFTVPIGVTEITVNLTNDATAGYVNLSKVNIFRKRSGSLVIDGTLTGNKLVANTITAGLLATSGLITQSAQINNGVIVRAHIEDLAVSNAKIADATIDGIKIVNAAITNAKIKNLAVDTLKIDNQAVTAQYSASKGSHTVNAFGSSWEDVVSVTFTLAYSASVIFGGGFTLDKVLSVGSSLSARARINGSSTVAQSHAGIANGTTEGENGPLDHIFLGARNFSAGTHTISIEGNRGGSPGTISNPSIYVLRAYK